MPRKDIIASLRAKTQKWTFGWRDFDGNWRLIGREFDDYDEGQRAAEKALAYDKQGARLRRRFLTAPLPRSHRGRKYYGFRRYGVCLLGKTNQQIPI